MDKIVSWNNNVKSKFPGTVGPKETDEFEFILNER